MAEQNQAANAAQQDVYTEIPILDLAPYLAGEDGALAELGAKVRHIQENIGFLAVVNHGVEWQLLQNVYSQLKRFFALPKEQKMRYRINELTVGYIPPNSTKYVTSIINENTKKDLNETLITALERPADHPLVAARTRFVGPNQWPEELDGFRDAIVAYQQSIKALGHKLLPIYALALDLPADYFDPFFTDPMMWSRNAHYPVMEAEENQYGIAPHCDHSFLTMLPTAEVSGLQVLTPNRNWVAAKYIDQGILVNTGEFLNRWSNGRFIATPHRVIPPNQDRYSVATFFNPTPDSIAVPLESCCSADNPARFEPMSMIDYANWYIDTNYQIDAGGKQEL